MIAKLCRDKALLLGCAGVFLGLATAFTMAHRYGDQKGAFDLDLIALALVIWGIGLFLLLFKRTDDKYLATYALVLFLWSIVPGYQAYFPATVVFLSAAMIRFFRRGF